MTRVRPPTGAIDVLGVLARPTGDRDVLSDRTDARHPDGVGGIAPAPARATAPGTGRGHAGSLGRAAVIPDEATSAQEALTRFHDEHSPLGKVRRIWFEVDDEAPGTASRDFDPLTIRFGGDT